MDDDREGSGKKSDGRRRVRGSLHDDSQEFQFTGQSPVAPSRRHATRDFILRSPQYPAAADSRDPLRDIDEGLASTSYGGTLLAEDERLTEAEERARLTEELSQLEESIEKLRRRHESLSSERKRQNDVEMTVEDAYKDSLMSNQAKDYETLEAMLKDMDDGALSALLTQDVGDSALQTLLQYLPDDPSSSSKIRAPARSAGIEGTGTAFELDEEERRLAGADNAELEELMDDALRRRLQRSDVLADALEKFCAFAIDSVDSHHVERHNSSMRRSRHITIHGRLSEDLGLIVIDMDIEDGDGSKDDTPRIRTLDVELDDPIYFSMGAAKLTSFVEEVNLPAILVAVRTTIPLARERFLLLREIAIQYRRLSEMQMNKWQSNGVDIEHEDSFPPLSRLINPEIMRTLRLESDAGGASLLVHFDIHYNSYGHARPQLSIEPIVPDATVPAQSITFLNELPQHFAHLCAHRPDNVSVSAALIATIDAFFGFEGEL